MYSQSKLPKWNHSIPFTHVPHITNILEGQCGSDHDETRNKLDEDAIVNQDNISKFRIIESTRTATLVKYSQQMEDCTSSPPRASDIGKGFIHSFSPYNPFLIYFSKKRRKSSLPFYPSQSRLGDLPGKPFSITLLNHFYFQHDLSHIFVKFRTKVTMHVEYMAQAIRKQLTIAFYRLVPLRHCTLSKERIPFKVQNLA